MTTINPAQEVITTRQLVLAREMYLHALEHSLKGGRLGNMIAVHNFHNAIEIVLKAIIAKYQIPMSPSYPRFPDLITAVNGFKQFKDQGKQLPYDQKILDLNKRRNDVQHDAAEPPPAMMEQWRVIVESFLQDVTRDYFDRDFELLSVADLIEDSRLRALMQKSHELLAEQRLKDAISLTALAFLWARLSISRVAGSEIVLDDRSVTHFIKSQHNRRYRESFDPDVDNQIVDIFEQMGFKLKELAGYVGVLASGVKLADYDRFKRAIPKIIPPNFGRSSTLYVSWYRVPQADLDECIWVINFVTETIVSWQLSGLQLSEPSLDEEKQQAFQTMIREVNIEHK